MATYSIIIKNGIIFDGTGSPLKQADIGIVNDKIKKVGNLQNDEATIIIDASNKYVCPGFIDITTHSDTHWTLFSQPSQESFIRQGITTIIGGHAGSSLAPLVKAEDIEGIQKWVDVSKININWQSVKEFLLELEKHQIGVNFGTFVGFGTFRRGIIGEQNRPANKDEISQMQFLLEKSLKEGGFGISMNLGAAHQKSATDEEINAILKTAGAFDVLVSHHLADEGKNILPALARLIEFSRNSGIHSHISHFKAIGKTAWHYFPQGLEMIEQARKEKARLTCDFFPYTRTGSNLYMLLPDWARESGKEYILRFIKGKERKNILEFLKELTLHYEKIIVASTLHDLDSKGKSILDLSQSSGISPEETILNLLEVNKLQVSIFNEAISEDNIELLAKRDYSAVSSDGVGYTENYRSETDLPHPRSFGAFPRFFSRFVKEKNSLSWENAVYKMTGFPAKILGIKDRGIIAEGAYADLVVVEPETIADRADYINPYQFPTGIDYVLINGAVALKDNSLTGLGKGRVLRHS
ncbi:MAG: amidohydrolase family protein [Candidatus Tagabacteria bacterium]